MNKKQLECELQRAIRAGVISSHDSVGCFSCTVYVSAMFDDGDHPVVVLSKRHDDWWFTDEGNTFMRQGAGSVEMSLRVGSVAAHFVDDLRMFVKALLMVERMAKLWRQKNPKSP